MTYWAGSGLSRPQRFSAACTTTGLPSWRSLTTVLRGSAGTVRETINATVTSPSRSTGIINTRRRTYVPTLTPERNRREAFASRRGVSGLLALQTRHFEVAAGAVVHAVDVRAVGEL